MTGKPRPRHWTFLLALLLACLALDNHRPARAQEPSAPAPQPGDANLTAPTTRPFLLHLPGIGGYRNVDRNLLRGFRKGGLHADVEVYDWTEGDAGIHALQAMDRNQREAGRIAKILTDRARRYPGETLMLTSHSGGGAMAIWTLERLPADVHVKLVMLLAPALSPDYDLTKALRHVDEHCYSFNSIDDELVLGMGCRVFGTMDGKQTDAAGRVGFIRPPDGDPKEYQKLIQRPYEAGWAALGNLGDHVGPMSVTFAAAILEPLFDLAPVPPDAEAAMEAADSRPMLLLSAPPATRPASASANLAGDARVRQ